MEAQLKHSVDALVNELVATELEQHAQVEQAVQLAANSFEASFAAPQRKTELLEQLKVFARENGCQIAA